MRPLPAMGLARGPLAILLAALAAGGLGLAASDGIGPSACDLLVCGRAVTVLGMHCGKALDPDLEMWMAWCTVTM
ncbi:MAG: hypothetical protein LC624_03740, partial [Halobacteriales archaeon]|nr:hypothetical protein [Halobacteriales archaeon]